MFICFNPVLQLGKCTVKAIGLIQDAIDHDTNNIGQYTLCLQIDGLDRNRLRTTEET